MFPCTRCGACCRRVGSMLPWWPWLREDGACAHLTEADECAIYEKRPLLCQIDALAEHLGITDKAAWHKANADLCNEWQAQDGMGAEYRVTVEKTGDPT